MAGTTERLETFGAQVTGGILRDDKRLARIEFRAILGKRAAHRAGHGQPDVGVDVDLAHAALGG